MAKIKGTKSGKATPIKNAATPQQTEAENPSFNAFVREVDDAWREEQFMKLLNKYGVFILAFCLMMVVGTAGRYFWNQHQLEKSQQETAIWLKKITEADGKAAPEKLALLEQNTLPANSGLLLLNDLRRGQAAIEKGDRNAAAAIYNKTAEQTSGKLKVFGELAHLLALWQQIETADPAVLSRELQPLAQAGSPWRFTALELLGLVAMRTQKWAEAEGYYQAILSSADIPAEVKQRAEIMKNHLQSYNIPSAETTKP
ncbi:MAG: hypothetical protein ACOYK8_02055 [Alphaproteobacteria bacterium]